MANACPTRSMAAMGALGFENILTKSQNVFEFLSLVQACFLPLPKNALVVSQPVKA